MVNDSVAPAFWGAGSKETCMTESQSVQRLLSVEYLMSYRAAVPEVLSSPGAVQLSVTELCVKLATLRSVILDGVSLTDLILSAFLIDLFVLS